MYSHIHRRVVYNHRHVCASFFLKALRQQGRNVDAGVFDRLCSCLLRLAGAYTDVCVVLQRLLLMLLLLLLPLLLLLRPLACTLLICLWYTYWAKVGCNTQMQF